MGKTYVVVGAGFRGFCDSMQLLKKPENNVIIIDSAPFFGGVSYSSHIKGFYIDKGVHLFDSVPQDLADLVDEIMEGQIRKLGYVAVSAWRGKLTDGFALPDLSALDQASKDRITQELKALAASGSKRVPTTFAELLQDRYGKTAGNIFAEIFQRIYNIDAHKVQPDAMSKTSFGRLKYMDDEQMLALKKSDPWLDSVLAARRSAVGKVDDLVTIYPTSGEGFRGFPLRGSKWLAAKGARICLGENIQSIENAGGKVIVQTDKQRIEADKVIWTNDNTKGLSAAMGFEYDAGTHISGTPMILAAFITQAKHIKDFSYVQNFDEEGFTYRTAAAGIYGNQISAEGNSFITCECPAGINSDRWKNADELYGDIWKECKALEVIHPDAELVDHIITRIPSTFKVAKLGYDDKIEEFRSEVTKRNPRIIFRNVKPFFRREIYLDSFNLPALVD